jgi:hypothetical protein
MTLSLGFLLTTVRLFLIVNATVPFSTVGFGPFV